MSRWRIAGSPILGLTVRDNSVSGFCCRLDEIRQARAEALASDASDRSTRLEAVSARLATAAMDAIGKLDVLDRKATTDQPITPRGCITQHVNELAVWGKPDDLLKALKTIRNQDITYIALACAVGANQHSAENMTAIVDAVVSEPEDSPDRLLSTVLLTKIAKRAKGVSACASEQDGTAVTPAPFDAAAGG